MKKHLFLFTIGPVQSFISQTRKTQDLYAVSKLLSELINSAIQEFEKACGKVIFPNEKLKSKPNRFLGEIETDNPQDIGKKIEDNLKDKFKSIAEDIFKKQFQNKTKPSYFYEQIKDFLQIFWVALEYDEKNYTKKYKEIEQFLGAIKNVKIFQQLNNGKGEIGRKCSLCGERNAIFYKKTSNNKKPAYIQNDSIELNKNELTFGEGLCAVCFTKRFYEKEHFPSTAGIATMDWLCKIDNGKIESYKNYFNNFDEQLFYEENLDEKYLKKYHYFKDDDSLKKAKQKLKEFYDIKTDKNKDKKLGKPSKYYALVMLDGDHIGKWLSGEFLEDKINLKEFHHKVSEKLGTYSKEVKKIIDDKQKGKLVYAGGDDVMAFVNIANLNNIMRELRDNFPKFDEIKNNSNEKIVKEGITSTASAGIVIAHYKTPLSEVLKWARKMEKAEAKDKGGRNAFAIAVLKHSGEIQKTIWKWKINKTWVIDTLKELVNELNNDNEGFSNNFIKNLNFEFSKLGEIDNDKLVETELKRLLYRSSKISGDKDNKKKKVNEWTNKLISLYYEAKSIENFFSFLNIADFLVRRTKQ